MNVKYSLKVIKQIAQLDHELPQSAIFMSCKNLHKSHMKAYMKTKNTNTLDKKISYNFRIHKMQNTYKPYNVCH